MLKRKNNGKNYEKMKNKIKKGRLSQKKRQRKGALISTWQQQAKVLFLSFPPPLPPPISRRISFFPLFLGVSFSSFLSHCSLFFFVRGSAEPLPLAAAADLPAPPLTRAEERLRRCLVAYGEPFFHRVCLAYAGDTAFVEVVMRSWAAVQVGVRVRSATKR